jgi:hypothetical protein
MELRFPEIAVKGNLEKTEKHRRFFTGHGMPAFTASRHGDEEGWELAPLHRRANAWRESSP